jgi:hypothetical protein
LRSLRAARSDDCIRSDEERLIRRVLEPAGAYTAGLAPNPDRPAIYHVRQRDGHLRLECPREDWFDTIRHHHCGELRSGVHRRVQDVSSSVSEDTHGISRVHCQIYAGLCVTCQTALQRGVRRHPSGRCIQPIISNRLCQRYHFDLINMQRMPDRTTRPGVVYQYMLVGVEHYSGMCVCLQPLVDRTQREVGLAGWNAFSILGPPGGVEGGIGLLQTDR